MSNNRLQSEKKFHDKIFTDNDKTRFKAKKYYSVNKNAKDIFYKKISNCCKNKKLLEYGCGVGNNIEIFEKFGAFVTGIDISEEGIKHVSKKIIHKKMNANCFVMDVENTKFNDSIFERC